MNSTKLVLIALLAIQISCITYNANLAKLYLEYAKVSYCSQSNIQSWKCGAPCNQLPGMKDITVVNKLAHEGQGYVAFDSNNKNIVVAIRGSSNIINWYNNLQANQIDYPGCSGCRVHQGFYQTYQDVQPTLLSAFKNLYQKYSSLKPTVVVTGHSLGGVVAELMAVDI